MMKQSILITCVLLVACTNVQVEAPAEDKITPLEQACMRDPLDPQRWEQLAEALAVAGQRERAASMYLQAASLRAHDARQDYAILKQARDEAVADNMPRTQVRRLGPALVEVLRIPAAPDLVRLEISNGNGITGAAARLARSLDVDGLKTVRLSNVKPFVVPNSRIEYQHDQQKMAQALSLRLKLPLQQRRNSIAYADMRIVLGHDARYLR
ncbi:hypothetical protein GJ699_13875 [Duganella sp. FT80W]|uniref:LytR/CpsA/Psr regulator C-terminal domain-containing protein n=1 Tax=Duganella guangzhouensis TaxID=2666084 RepID=A0A6I2KZV4_9BURK|nr:LytR C-terminal domain-containing protein [Duganella guangzhouensis]MRW91080.1 hypothetical protein [Duganella guangzhouensis]